MEEMAPHHQQRRRRRSTASKEMAQTNRCVYVFLECYVNDSSFLCTLR
jgi:hypothetical protein